MGGKVALQRGWRGCSDTRRAARGGDSVASAAGARAGPPPSVCAAGHHVGTPRPEGADSGPRPGKAEAPAGIVGGTCQNVSISLFITFGFFFLPFFFSSGNISEIR